jgi:hypothetical protein
MADCPNCGRQALRTKDWACQWCGYPLISNAYKTIDKTYKEFQDERIDANRPAPREKYEYKVEYPAEVERKKPPVKPDYPPPPREEYSQASLPILEPGQYPPKEQAPLPLETEPEIIESPRDSVTAPVIQIFPAPEPQEKVEPESLESAEPVAYEPPSAEPAPPPKTKAVPPEIHMPKAAPPPPPEAVVEPEPAPEPEPVPEPEPSLKPEDVKNGMTLTADDIDQLFRRDKDAANDALTSKSISIRGVVDKVFVREHLDIRYIMMTNTGRNMSWNLRCTFSKEEASKLGRLQEGQEAVVQGSYDGYSKNIIFKDCALA